MIDARIWYPVATLGPAGLIALGLALGGLWSGAGLFAMTVVIFVLDRRSIAPARPRDDSGLGLSVAIAVAHFALLGLVAARAGHLTLLEAALTLSAAGLWLGQVSNSNAHELIHQPARWARRLGRALYASLIYGHHTSAHILVHHVHAATPRDPNTSRLGESYWQFVPRAWIGAYRAGFQAERRRRATAPLWQHPYVGNWLASLVTAIAAYALGGGVGLAAYAFVVVYAQLQLLLSDYVQHYGLVRDPRSDGGFEPMGAAHSWNAPHAASSALMLNAPRHSDHHVNPRRSYPALEIDADMPTLPHALPVMAVLALVPPIWRRVMDRRVAKWVSVGA